MILRNLFCKHLPPDAQILRKDARRIRKSTARRHRLTGIVYNNYPCEFTTDCSICFLTQCLKFPIVQSQDLLMQDML